VAFHKVTNYPPAGPGGFIGRAPQRGLTFAVANRGKPSTPYSGHCTCPEEARHQSPGHRPGFSLARPFSRSPERAPKPVGQPIWAAPSGLIHTLHLSTFPGLPALGFDRSAFQAYPRNRPISTPFPVFPHLENHAVEAFAYPADRGNDSTKPIPRLGFAFSLWLFRKSKWNRIGYNSYTVFEEKSLCGCVAALAPRHGSVDSRRNLVGASI